jgi:hypothetical protein
VEGQIVGGEPFAPANGPLDGSLTVPVISFIPVGGVRTCMSSDSNRTTVKPGQPVYDDEGNELGLIHGLTEQGFHVRIDESVDHIDLETDPGHEFGEGYLMWRCSECGEMGQLEDGYPEACPNCGTAKRNLYAWLED